MEEGVVVSEVELRHYFRFGVYVAIAGSIGSGVIQNMDVFIIDELCFFTNIYTG